MRSLGSVYLDDNDSVLFPKYAKNIVQNIGNLLRIIVQYAVYNYSQFPTLPEHG